jgi:hypothetical protein
MERGGDEERGLGILFDAIPTFIVGQNPFRFHAPCPIRFSIQHPKLRSIVRCARQPPKLPDADAPPSPIHSLANSKTIPRFTSTLLRSCSSLTPTFISTLIRTNPS